MYSKLEAYVEMIFEGADGLYIRDAKEELLANLYDKYNDLLDEGKSATEAYQLVIAGIGEIDELIKNPPAGEISDRKPYNHTNNEINKKESKEKIVKTEKTEDKQDNLGKEIKNQSAKAEEKEKEKKKIIFILWASVIAAFVVFSAIGDWWGKMWLIFPFGGFLTVLILYVLSEPKKDIYIYGMLWTGTVSLYLFINTIFDGFRRINVGSWSWVIFIFAIIAHIVIRNILKERKK
ncbi:MAG: permease prefix domain 1-containing protein [Firmicutes bacterium]|nr:permease prefix domain 1-containing protein [Bacillota bacterium]